MNKSVTLRVRDSGLNSDKAARLAEMLRALAHPLRLRIVSLLCQEDRRVNALVELLGARQAIVSQQLRILRMSRLVFVARDKAGMTYRISEPRLRNLMRCLRECSTD